MLEPVDAADTWPDCSKIALAMNALTAQVSTLSFGQITPLVTFGGDPKQKGGGVGTTSAPFIKSVQQDASSLTTDYVRAVLPTVIVFTLVGSLIAYDQLIKVIEKAQSWPRSSI